MTELEELSYKAYGSVLGVLHRTGGQVGDPHALLDILTKIIQNAQELQKNRILDKCDRPQ